MYAYDWTEEYGIFRLTVGNQLQKELRPVFHEELDFFGFDEHWDYPKDAKAPLLWAEGVRRYILNGVCIAEAVGGGFYTKPKIEYHTEERVQLHEIDTHRLYEVNKHNLSFMEQHAVGFIREQFEEFKDKGFSFVCAFSGGKDSLVLLDLVASALEPDKFTVIFSNTGMELSDTIKCYDRAKQHWSKLKFVEAKCHMKPSESWDEFGPPAAKNRWCCVVHKSVPTILAIREITNTFNSKVVVFDGVRGEESARRAKYDDVSIGAKNISQINVSPILKWNSAEINCYLLGKGIYFNDAYKNGVCRVGCMVCPMSSDWWDYIIGQRYKDESEYLRKKIEEYVRRAKPLKEQKKYIEGGGWKTRSGGRDLPHGGNRASETIADNSVTYTMKYPCQDWLEVSKILGVVTELKDNDGIQRIDNKNFRFHIDQHDGVYAITYSPLLIMDRYVLSHLRAVANKVCYCRGCKACEVQCPTGAFTIKPTGEVFIRDWLCIHCSNCMTFTDKGCMIAKSLSVSLGGVGMNLKGMNSYQNFGFQQNFLEHFMANGVACFSMNTLGNMQYVSLKKWLEHSNIIKISNKDRSVSITELGKKLMEFGPYNPFTWAIIWSNLAYNSIISHWYCLSVEQGTHFETGDLVTMLGDEYSLTTRRNAVGSLLSTFRNSPIGPGLKQGVPVGKGYVRVGWDTPDAVALLYSLFLYSEHTGRRSFTFSSLINERNNPDATGISPSDIFGIDVKQFRDQIQGLAIAFPKYLRVSFISNLDNIILEPAYTSLDILNLATEQS